MADSYELLLKRIIDEVRSYRGIDRKSGRRLTSSLMPENTGRIIAAKGEDGAVLSIGGKKLVFAADGIMDEMVDANPRWAGYCSVLVNVNDMLAMGAEPIAAVNVISARNEGVLTDIVSGMREACGKFGVEMVGGHLHPDSAHNEISVAMIGEVSAGGPLLSTTAKPGDAIVAMCDLDGAFTPELTYSWDTTSKRSRDDVKIATTKFLSAVHHLTSGKDISNPGLLGTLAMLLESSRVGGDVDIGKVPIPQGVGLLQWLKAYQGFGFIGTAADSELGGLSAELEGSGLTMCVIGRVQKDRQFKVRLGGAEGVLFDLATEKITGLY